MASTPAIRTLLLSVALAACASGDSTSRDRAGGGAADAPGQSVADAAPPPGADASSPVDAAAGPAPHRMHSYCSSADGPVLRIAVASDYSPDDACYGRPEVDGVILLLNVAGVTAGQRIPLGPAGMAYVCPADQLCAATGSGEVAIEDVQPDRITGVYLLDGGALKGVFDAATCAPPQPCP